MNEKEILAAELLSQIRNSLHFLPTSDSSVSNLFLLYLLNDIIVNKRRNIIEFGSGISTIYISKVLSDYNVDANFISIEENSQWAEIVSQIIDQNKLSFKPRIILSPLKPSRLALNDLNWYDEQLLSSEIFNYKFDLVVIDGPSAWKPGQELARFPAIPFLFKNISENVSIFLDDAKREGEQKIQNLWKQTFGYSFDIFNDDFALVQIGTFYNIKF